MFHTPVDTHARDVKNESRRSTMTKRDIGLISSLDNGEDRSRPKSRTKGVTWVAPRWSLSSARIDTYSGGSPPHLPQRCWCAKVPVRIQGGGVRGAARPRVYTGGPCACVTRVYYGPALCLRRGTDAGGVNAGGQRRED